MVRGCWNSDILRLRIRDAEGLSDPPMFFIILGSSKDLPLVTYWYSIVLIFCYNTRLTV